MAPNKKQKLNVKAASKKNNKNLKTNIESLTKKSDEVEKNIVVKGSSKLCETYWIKFTNFCSDNELEDPSFITNKTVRNIKLCLTFKCCTEGLGFKTAEGVRSGIRNHYSRILKLDDGWSNAACVGNPCDSNEVKDQITSIKKTN